jgi:hypothetical protein
VLGFCLDAFNGKKVPAKHRDFIEQCLKTKQIDLYWLTELQFKVGFVQFNLDDDPITMVHSLDATDWDATLLFLWKCADLLALKDCRQCPTCGKWNYEKKFCADGCQRIHEQRQDAGVVSLVGRRRKQ